VTRRFLLYGEGIMSKAKASKIRNNVTLALFLLGLVLSTMSLAAEFLGLDITPGFGMVQMLQLLLGFSCLTLASFLFLHNRRQHGTGSLQADIAVRLAATGLVLVYVSGLSDLIGIGTHVTPSFDQPFVGPLQVGGIAFGILSIVAGALLYHTSRGSRDTSSLDFLANGDN
jgi:hypothetical protein